MSGFPRTTINCEVMNKLLSQITGHNYQPLDVNLVEPANTPVEDRAPTWRHSSEPLRVGGDHFPPHRVHVVLVLYSTCEPGSYVAGNTVRVRVQWYSWFWSLIKTARVTWPYKDISHHVTWPYKGDIGIGTHIADSQNCAGFFWKVGKGPVAHWGVITNKTQHASSTKVMRSVM